MSSNSTNTGMPKDKVAKGTIINSKTFNDHVHVIDASNITDGLSIPAVNYKKAIVFKQRVKKDSDGKVTTVNPIYKINDNGYIHIHGIQAGDQDKAILAATAAEAFTINNLPAQCDRFLLIGFAGGTNDHGAGCVPTVKDHAWVVTCWGNDPSRWIAEYCPMGSQVTSAAFQTYTTITPKYYYPAYGRISNCIQPKNGYRLCFKRPWSNLSNNYPAEKDFITKSPYHFLKLNNPYKMYGYTATYGTPFASGMELSIETDKLSTGLFCPLSSAASLSTIVLNGSGYDSFLYRGPNSTTGLNLDYVMIGETRIKTYHNNIDTYVFKDFKITQVGSTGSYLLQYFYTTPASTINPQTQNATWGYVSCNKTESAESALSYKNATIINGINKLTVQIVATPIKDISTQEFSDAIITNFNIAARIIHQFHWDDISEDKSNALYSDHKRKYTNATKMCMCIQCTPKYFIENIVQNIPRDTSTGRLYKDSNPVKKLFIRASATQVYEITSIFHKDDWEVNYTVYEIDKKSNNIKKTSSSGNYIFKITDTKNSYVFYEYEVDSNKSTDDDAYSTYRDQPNPHPISQYFQNVVSFNSLTNKTAATGLSTIFYFWRFQHVCVAVSPTITLYDCKNMYNVREFATDKENTAVIPVSKIPELIQDILNQKNSNTRYSWTVYESVDPNVYYTNTATWTQTIIPNLSGFGFYKKITDAINYIAYSCQPDCYFEQHNLYAEQITDEIDDSTTDIPK